MRKRILHAVMLAGLGVALAGVCTSAHANDCYGYGYGSGYGNPYGYRTGRRISYSGLSPYRSSRNQRYSSFYGPSRYTFRPQPRRTTGVYHPPTFVPHRDHYHYQPGHYHYYRR